MNGWICLHRKIINNSIWQEPKLLKLWILCLMEATHKEIKQPVGGKIVTLTPGQFVTGLNSLARKYNLGAKEGKGVPAATIWRWLKVLERDGYLDVNPIPQRYSIVTIKNWTLYQQQNQLKSDQESDQVNDQVSDQVEKSGIPCVPMVLEDKEEKSDQVNDQESDRKVIINNKDNKINNNNILSEIENLKESFSPGTGALIDSYWDVIRRTRKTNKVQPSIILKTMQAWLKFDDIVVQYAVKKHIQSYDDGQHTEKYTLGIMNKTTPEQATDALDTVGFRPRNEPSRRALDVLGSEDFLFREE